MPEQPPSLLEGKFSNRFSWPSIIPLVFSLIYFMGLFFNRYSLPEYSLIFGAYLIFVGLFVLCKTRPKAVLLWIGLNAALTLAISPFYGFAYCLMWNSAYFITLKLAPRLAIPALILLLAVIGFSGHLSKTNLAFYLLVGGVPFLGLAIFGFQDKRIEQEERLKQEKNRQLEQLATIAERERIARDMHDVLGHSLTAISLKSHLAERLAEAGQLEQALIEIRQVRELCSSSLADVRQAISNYKAKSFYHQLRQLTEQLQQAGFEVTQQVEQIELDAAKESNLTLILTEAVTNILRHSQGRKVEIELHQKPFRLSVFNEGEVLPYQPGNGLKGIQERAQTLGTQLNFNTANGFSMELSE